MGRCKRPVGIFCGISVFTIVGSALSGIFTLKEPLHTEKLVEISASSTTTDETAPIIVDRLRLDKNDHSVCYG